MKTGAVQARLSWTGHVAPIPDLAYRILFFVERRENIQVYTNELRTGTSGTSRDRADVYRWLVPKSLR